VDEVWMIELVLLFVGLPLAVVAAFVWVVVMIRRDTGPSK
jgi:hypothetical protein